MGRSVPRPFRLLLALLLCPQASLIAQRAGAPAGWPEAVTAFDRLLREDSVVGGSLAYVRDGKILTRHDAGFMDPAHREAIGPGTLFHWGSITKTLTSVAIMQLRDRGLLALDDPITRWVPELRQVHNPFGTMDQITLRMLLSHTGGFQNPTWPYRQYLAWEPFEPTRWEQLVAMMPYQEILFPPGSRYGYSNPAYIYLARVIEGVTGDPYQSYIYKQLWVPLQMEASYFGGTPPYLARRRPHNFTVVKDSSRGEVVVDNGTDFDPGVTIPNGGWNAPMEDLARWMGFLSGSGERGRGTMLLARTSVEELWRPVVQMSADGGEQRGLGFFLLRPGDRTLVGHTGEQAGFRSFFFLDPATGAGVIGCVTTTNEARPEASARLFQGALRSAVQVLR